MLHILINLAGSIMTDLVPVAADSADANGSISSYIAAIIVISLVSTLPGLWQLRKVRIEMADTA